MQVGEPHRMYRGFNRKHFRLRFNVREARIDELVESAHESGLAMSIEVCREGADQERIEFHLYRVPDYTLVDPLPEVLADLAIGINADIAAAHNIGLGVSIDVTHQGNKERVRFALIDLAEHNLLDTSAKKRQRAAPD